MNYPPLGGKDKEGGKNVYNFAKVQVQFFPYRIIRNMCINQKLGKTASNSLPGELREEDSNERWGREASNCYEGKCWRWLLQAV